MGYGRCANIPGPRRKQYVRAHLGVGSFQYNHQQCSDRASYQQYEHVPARRSCRNAYLVIELCNSMYRYEFLDGHGKPDKRHSEYNANSSDNVHRHLHWPWWQRQQQHDDQL